TEHPPYANLETLGVRLQKGLQNLFDVHGLESNIQGLSMAFHVGFGKGPITDYASLQHLDLEGYAKFASTLVDHGVWVTGRGIWYLSAAHTKEDIDQTLERVEAALGEGAAQRRGANS